MKQDERWDMLEALQETFPTFDVFLVYVMEELYGFNCTDIQLDIASFIDDPYNFLMVMAQRGEAKTTIASIYSVWRLIHNPALIILICSAGAHLASDISTGIVQVIEQLEDLACMRPDKSAGDRSSRESYDINHQLKGPNKSASVACMSITSNIQGKRADLLIADDIESQKNSSTDDARTKLLLLMNDFTSICSRGKILFLGTPQSVHSVYGTLPAKGYRIRIWTGRYPTPKQIDNYDGNLAPMILANLKANPALGTNGGLNGDMGQPTDPVLFDEDTLCNKELNGLTAFMLQQMLDTSLLDKDIYPLKADRIIFTNISPTEGPMHVRYASLERNLLTKPDGWFSKTRYYRASSVSDVMMQYKIIHMYIDPSGGGANGDEVAYAITTYVNGYIFVLASGGLRGGYEEQTLKSLAYLARDHKVTICQTEKNFGNGAYTALLSPIMKEIAGIYPSDDNVHGQKELRICDTLEPIINNNRLVMDEGILEADWKSVQQYPINKRTSYMLFNQLERITRVRGALKHDDRLDALASSCAWWSPQLAVDRAKRERQTSEERYKASTTIYNSNGDKMKLVLPKPEMTTIFGHAQTSMRDKQRKLQHDKHLRQTRR